MATNTKIRTEDVLEILDFKIKASSDHLQLDVATGEDYNSVLAKIAARSPSFLEKAALENAVDPSAANPYVTLSELNESLRTIPWISIGPSGSGSDFEGSNEQPFLDAFATSNKMFYIKPATYTFSSPLTIPNGVKLFGSSSPIETILSSGATTLIVGQNTYISFLTISTTSISDPAISAASSLDVEFENCIITSPSGTTTIDVTGANRFTAIDCAFVSGNASGTGLTSSTIARCYFDALGSYGLNLDSPSDNSIWGNVFYAGTPQVISGTNVRIVGNHFNSGIGNITPISSVILRANTPSSNNNEDEALTSLLQYLGSPSASQATPAYSNDFTGAEAQDLTARASAIDICLQWIYEERNFSLIAQTEPLVVSWNPTANTLTTTDTMLLVSSHRDAVWKLEALTKIIPNGSFLYYIIDRSLTTSDITLLPIVAPLGSIPINTVPPTGSPNNRQIYVLACNLNGTLWWRGGGGSRFPSTGGYTGEYFVDGSSKSLLTYIGATDYNDSDPNYSSNFSGIQGESLVTRIDKTDTLIKRLFEHTNLDYYISSNGFIFSENDKLKLIGTLTFTLPHASGEITIADTEWTIPDGSLLYFTWDQTTFGTATSTIATTVPLPDSYPLVTKYFVAAVRVGNMFYLWDGTRLPINGGRWPTVSLTRDVLPTAVASTLLTDYGNITNNTVWTQISGTMHLLWENLAVATSTGISLARNQFSNQLTPSSGLTDIADGEGLVVTHTWNEGDGSPQNIIIEKRSLPLTSILEQNQFLWVKNRSGYLLFLQET